MIFANATETAAKLLETVRCLINEIHPGQKESLKPDLDSSLDRDLGLDSLAQVELLVRIEKSFNISLSEQILVTVDTVRDLLRAILSSGAGKRFTIAREIGAIKLGEVEETPLKAETLVEVLEWHAKKHPDRPHIRFYSDQEEDEVITYLELWNEAERVASGLQHYGLAPGESVLIMLPTGRQYFFTFFGVLMAGGIPVPVYPPGRLKQIEEHLLRHCAIANNSLARIMVTMEEAKQFARLMHTHVINLRNILTSVELNKAGTEALPSFRKPVLAKGHIGFLQYTSGSTGMPKGVVLTHANLLANIRAMATLINVSADDVFVSWLPLYHDMGLIGAWLGSLHFACQLIIMSPLAFIAKPQRWLWAIHKYGGTLSAAPNFAYELCLRRLEDNDIIGLDLSSWRIAFNGAEAVNPVTISRFIERFAGYGFKPEAMLPVYGLAESSVGLAFPQPGSGVKIDRIQRETFMASGEAIPVNASEASGLEFVCCGEPLPGHQIRVVDAADRELPERMEGNLQFTGPSSTSGYFKNPEKTKELFHGEWLDSGDKAYLAAGSVYITGRAKDIIIRAGRNIYPVELEEAIGNLDGIRSGNVAVFGAASTESGTERLIVLAETRKKNEQALEKIRGAINTIVTDLVGDPPDEVVLAPPNTVLKTSSGKIRRNASKHIYEKGLVGKKQQAVWLQLVRFTLQGVLPKVRSLMKQVQATLYAAWCWLLYCFLAPFVGLLVFILPTEGGRWTVMRFAVRILSSMTGTRIILHGRENLPGQDTQCIFVSNHASYLDGYALTAVLGRPLSFIAKAELRAKTVIYILLKRIGTLFVERFDQQRGLEDAKLISEKGGAGRSLFFFPEGTFMRMPGLLPFRMGAFTTAAHLNMPIIPIAIRGTRSILRAGSWFPRHGSITVTIGSPIYPEISPGGLQEEAWATALRLRNSTREWILLHCGEPNLEHERPRLQPSGPVLNQ
ncbi:MAG: AMP-binding protein [Deltaproteobacteria bacterium]|nr:AMP-binding protein [Deltaproteobacteria bacterium]